MLVWILIRCANVVRLPSINWAVLECHGNSRAIHSAHEETEESADSKELLKCLGVDCGDLEKTENHHVANQRPFAAVSVGCEAKACGALLHY